MFDCSMRHLKASAEDVTIRTRYGTAFRIEDINRTHRDSHAHGTVPWVGGIGVVLRSGRPNNRNMPRIVFSKGVEKHRGVITCPGLFAGS